jgi:hypothetical protein
MEVSTVVDRVRAEFEEMPGMTLTVPQASRLFGLEEALCRRVVDQLVAAAYLRKTDSGTVSRITR